MTPKRTRGPHRAVNPHGLTPKQAAHRLGISQPSLAYAANAGAIPRVKRGRGWTRYLESDLASVPVQSVARKIRNHERQVLAAAQKREEAMAVAATAAAAVSEHIGDMAKGFAKASKMAIAAGRRIIEAAQNRQEVGK